MINDVIRGSFFSGSYMKKDLLPVTKKRTDSLIAQTKTHPQGTLEFKMNKRVQSYSISPSINLIEEGQWLVVVTFFLKQPTLFSL